MSVQNNLQKPAFTKSVMGYSVSEVERYVDHVTERYNSVCRENAELKRRVLNLGVRLDELESRLSEHEESTATKKVLDRSALRDVFAMLEGEKIRYAEYLDSLMSRLNDIAADAEEPDEDADSEWTCVLEGFIEEADGADESDEDSADGSEEYVESCGGIPFEVIPAEDGTSADTADCDACEAPLEALDGVSDEPSFDGDEASAPTECTDANEETASPAKTPAEIAAELDFYTDDVHRDGESFDPMTLAAQITAKRSRPNYSGISFTVEKGDE